jgi:predicted CoA-binding protein
MSIENDIFASCRTIAIVGLSSNPARASYGVAEYFQSQGYRIIPVNPNETEVLGEKAYPDLRSIPERVDLVNVFRRPEHVPEIVDEAIAIGARALWLQQGITHPEAEAKARAAGLLVVSDACMMVMHRVYR